MSKASALSLGLGILFALGCGGGGHSNGMTQPDLPPQKNSAAGTVTYKGAPLPGVTVTIFDANNNVIAATTSTDAQGRYSFSGLEATGNVPEDYLIWATQSNYALVPAPAPGCVGRASRFSQNMLLRSDPNMQGLNTSYVEYLSTVATGSMTGGDFQAFDGTQARVLLPRTGQTTSYAAGDDGALKKGVAYPTARFTDNQDGTVTDRLTGLIWLRNASFTAPTTWGAAITAVGALASGSAGLSDGSRPGDWRMPDINELESLVDVSATSPALSPGHPFQNVSTGVYWTSTSYYGGNVVSPAAWTLRLGDGRWMNDSGTNIKLTNSNAVWAVRGNGGGAVSLPATGMWVVYQTGDDGWFQKGVALTSARFIDNGNGTLTDSMTGLVWLKRADAFNLPWSQALAAIGNLASGQFGLSDGSKPGDWRMPNRHELQSLSDRMQTNHCDYFNFAFYKMDGTLFQAPVFSAFQPFTYYWTSSTCAQDPTLAWTTFSCDFGVYSSVKANAGYSLAVRGPL